MTRGLVICTLFWMVVMGCSDEPLLINPNPNNEEKEEEEEEEEEQRIYMSEIYELGDYSVEIYYPSDYDSTSKYPILYFNDGGLFADVFGLLTFKETDPFLMVGILGQNPRAERFLPYYDANFGDYTPGAEEYSKFIVEDIIPFVEGKYSVNSSKRAIFGISFGGIHATWIGIQYPQVFKFVGALSPSFWVADGAIFSESVGSLVQSGVGVPHRFYFDRGTKEWRNLVPFISHLESADLEYGTNIFYYEVIGAAHESEYWARRIIVPFKLFLEGNPEDKLRGLELQSYCIPNTSPSLPSFSRLNPIVSYENGVIMSVMTEATYNIIEGSGTVMSDGTYSIASGNSMTVEVVYKDFSKTIILSACD